jgi:hypothetical protein
MRKRTPSSASTEKPLPRPGTTSTVRMGVAMPLAASMHDPPPIATMTSQPESA